MKVFRAIYGDALTRQETPARSYQLKANLAVLDGFYLAESINVVAHHGEIVWNKEAPLAGSREDLRIMIGSKEGVTGHFYIDIRTEKAPLLVNPKETQIPSGLTEHDLNLAEVYGQLIERGKYGTLELIEDEDA